MIELVLGMPGTGKSTFAKSHKFHMTFDLGHNAFKSDAERDKFYHKSQKATAGILSNYAKFSNVYWDTYPEYFDLKIVKEYIGYIHITFAIPDEHDIDMIIDRVGARDGYDSEFYHLYKKRGRQWIREWNDIYRTWYMRFGGKKVTLITRYDA